MGIALAALVPASGDAIAQPAAVIAAPAPTASQITPPSFRPAPESGTPTRGLPLPEPPKVEVNPAAATLFVRLGGVEVDGQFPEMLAATDALRARVASGKMVSGADIFAAAAELETAYARAGFVLARVILPPQKLDDGGVLHLTVIDGFIEKIETKDLPERVRQRISDILAPLVDRPRSRLRDIERRLLLAGDMPGVILRSTLAPGLTTGATVLVIEANYQPVAALLSFDNSLPTSLGTYALGVGFDTNAVLGFGEVFYLRVLGNPNGGTNGFFTETPLNRTLAAGVVMPLGSNGFSFNLEGTDARTAPISTITGLQSSSLFDRLSARLRYAAIRSRQMNISFEAALDIESDIQTLAFGTISLPLSQDRLTVLRLTSDGDYLTPWQGIVTARVTGSLGLPILGARTAAQANVSDTPLSRQGADANFTKMELTIGYNQLVRDLFTVSFGARAQYSFGQALLRSEQIGIASPSGLSSFDAGSLQGDSGFVLRGELLKPLRLPQMIPNIGFILTPYLFGAVGEVFLAAPTALEKSSITATSYGLGLRLNDGKFGTQSFGSLSLEYGFEQRNDGTPTNNRFTLLFSQRF